MNDCDGSILFNSNYDWGFRRVLHMFNSVIAVFVDDELYAPVDDKLTLIIDNIKL
jgi:hypothetical protein